MAAHLELGVKAEEMAVVWLSSRNYHILERNWRCGLLEVDIIAKKGDTLHFIEVKARKYSRFGNPEDSVGKKKFKNIQRASNIYLLQNPGYDWIQYDILAITLYTNKDPEYFLIADVYL